MNRPKYHLEVTGCAGGCLILAALWGTIAIFTAMIYKLLFT